MPGGSDYFRGYARDVGVNPPIGGATNVQDALTAGSAPAGVSIVRAFPFAFDLADLATGVPVYTPTVGDVLMDAWVTVVVPWDGTTPQCDVGLFTGGQTAGLFGNLGNVIDMTGPATTIVGFTVANTTDLLVVSTGFRPEFATVDPLCVCVSQNGTSGGGDPGSTAGTAVLYTEIATPA